MFSDRRTDLPGLRATLVAGIGFGVALGCAPVFAAQAAGPGAAAAEADTLAEVLVTARKSTESLQQVPLSVTAITAEQIEDRQIRSVDDVARYTPGLVFDKAFGRATERPVIRGMGNVLAGVQFGVEAGAAYFIDGVYYPGDIQSLDMSSIERVEVVRGPQSALYGRNTYSGAINFITRSPGDKLDATFRTNWDSDEHNASVRVSGPLGSMVKGSLAATSNTFLGQWTNQVTQQRVGQERSTIFSGSLQIDPTEDISISLRASYNRDRDGTRPFWFQSPLANNCYPGTRSLGSYALAPNNPNQYFCGTLRAGGIYLNDGAAANGVAVIDPSVPTNLLNATPASTLYNTGPGVAYSGVARNLRVYLARFDWDLAGSGYTLTLDGGARSDNRKTGSDSDFSSFNSLSPTNLALGFEAGGANTSIDDYKSSSVELRLSSPADRNVTWLVGANLYQQTQKSFDLNFAFPEGQALPFAINKTKNTAYFAMLEWKFLPKWSVAIEGRQATENKKLTEFCTSTTSCPNAQLGTTVALATAANPGGQQFYGDTDFKRFTPRAMIRWQATDSMNLYASYAEGTKPGGFNGSAGLTVTPAQTTYDEESSKNYELGMKANWLNDRLQTNLSLYRIEARKIQLTTAIVLTTNPAAVTSLATNQGDGEVEGFEFEGRWRATRHLTLAASYSRADSKFTKGCDDFQWILTSGGGTYVQNAALPQVGGCPASPNNPNGQGNASIKGKQFPLSAKSNASVSADYRAPIMGGQFDFYTNLGASYVDRRPVQVHNLAWVPAATIIDLRVGVQGDKWQAGIYGRNIGNNDAPTVATRWFSNPYIGTASPAVPGLALLKTPVPVPTANASYSLPRAFFGGFRRERQVGLEFSYSLSGNGR